MAVALQVTLPVNRDKLGTIELIDLATGLAAWGPAYCYGRADHGTAARHGNPGADQSLPYGNTPTGGYSVTSRRHVSAAEAPKYGAQDALRIDGVTGRAMVRKANGTHDLLIHGGRPTMGASLLRSTNGCLRLLDLDMQSLLVALGAAGAAYPFDLTIAEGNPGQDVAGGADDGYEDPPTA